MHAYGVHWGKGGYTQIGDGKSYMCCMRESVRHVVYLLCLPFQPPTSPTPSSHKIRYFFVSQRAKYVAVFVGGKYHGGKLDDGSGGSDGGGGGNGGNGGGGVDMVVALVELSGWLTA